MTATRLGNSAISFCRRRISLSVSCSFNMVSMAGGIRILPLILACGRGGFRVGGTARERFRVAGFIASPKLGKHENGGADALLRPDGSTVPAGMSLWRRPPGRGVQGSPGPSRDLSGARDQSPARPE